MIDGWMVTLTIFILGLLWKVASSHFTLTRLDKKYGIGRYTYFTHIDVRKNKARW